MAPGYHFDRAAEYSLVQLADAVTDAFRGYPLPVYESAARLARLVRVQGLDLAHSMVIRVGSGNLAGVGFLGVRANRAWISGFGIAPPHRGRRLASRLLDQLLDQARSAGAVDVRLEVLTDNLIARHVYSKAGFRVLRDLVSVERAPWSGMRGHSGEFRADRVTVEAAVQAAHELERTPPCWQREAASLLTGSAYGLTIRQGSRTVGSALHSTRDGASALHHLACRPEAATGVLDAVVPVLAGEGPGAVSRHITLQNEPDPGGLLPALLARGFRETMRQHELHRTL